MAKLPKIPCFTVAKLPKNLFLFLFDFISIIFCFLSREKFKMAKLPFKGTVTKDF